MYRCDRTHSMTHVCVPTCRCSTTCSSHDRTARQAPTSRQQHNVHPRQDNQAGNMFLLLLYSFNCACLCKIFKLSPARSHQFEYAGQPDVEFGPEVFCNSQARIWVSDHVALLQQIAVLCHSLPLSTRSMHHPGPRTSTKPHS